MPEQAVILQTVKFLVLHLSKNVVQNGACTSLPGWGVRWRFLCFPGNWRNRTFLFIANNQQRGKIVN